MRTCTACGTHTDDFAPRGRHCRSCVRKWSSNYNSRRIATRRCPGCEEVSDNFSQTGTYCRRCKTDRELERRIRLASLEERRCPTCRQHLPQAQFAPRSPRCRVCQSSYSRRYSYGLTPESYESLLVSQGGCCAICLSNDPGGKGTWHVDHDHSCCPAEKTCGGCVRGLLCAGCNLMLGAIKDNQETLRRACDYLGGSLRSVPNLGQ